jgi:hypothetical protein
MVFPNSDGTDQRGEYNTEWARNHARLLSSAEM